MKIDSTINVLGSMMDWNLIHILITNSPDEIAAKGGAQNLTSIKTTRSFQRFENAIKSTFLRFPNNDIKTIFVSALNKHTLDSFALTILFWNASQNNDLLHYINNKVYFPAFYSGRMTIKKEEIEACLSDLKNSEPYLRKWSIETIKTTARKYITLLMKFGLLENTKSKTIIHPFLSDQLFVVFVYWLVASADKPNLISSPWLSYCFSEFQPFIQRLTLKKYARYFNVIFTGDRLEIQPIIPYESIYEYVNKSRT